MWKLNYPVQCQNCPWRVDSDLASIPHYSPDQHQNLKATIAKPGDIKSLGEPVQPQMACHKSLNGGDRVCIGWLYNQINEGNNLNERVRMLSCENPKDLQVIGDQFETFEQTFR